MKDPLDRLSRPATKAGRASFKANLTRRHRIGAFGQALFQAATVFGILVLAILLLDIFNDSLGYAAIEYKVDPASLTASGQPLEALSAEELIQILNARLNANRIRTLEKQQPLAERSQPELVDIVEAEVAKPDAVETWSLIDSLFNRPGIFVQAQTQHPQAAIVFQTWLDRGFLAHPQSSNPLYAGVRTAILGSLLVIAITILVAFPIGIGAAIYLEEYAADTRTHRAIQANINNLAGVPSIIYGMLGLAVFVRALGPLTSGAMMGFEHADPNNGRTILSAGLTMALLILPVIIINAQEAIKAVPSSLREAAYGLGATRWQTVWSHVLPGALPGILTGAILSISRAFGETAPLVIVGASTYIPFDPDGLFSKFTTLPIQIYQWTSRPQDEFRNIAAAAIIVLMVLLLALNAAAILLRNYFSRRTV